jgi:transposase
VSLRQVINAILYSLKTGCQWRQLPREFPAWTAVYYYFRRWSSDGTWARLHHLLHARLQQKAGRHKHPTAGCLDSQSVKCTAVSGVRGFDAGKGVNGRKRHLLVDSLGWHGRRGNCRQCARPGRGALAVKPSCPAAVKSCARFGSMATIAVVCWTGSQDASSSIWRWCCVPNKRSSSYCCPAGGWSSAPSGG